LLALLVTLAAATPEAAPAQAAPAQAAKKPAADEMVCKTEQVTGSMFPKKICRKKSEADAIRAQEQAQIRESQRTVTAPVH
jgi:predicted secreted protein